MSRKLIKAFALSLTVALTAGTTYSATAKTQPPASSPTASSSHTDQQYTITDSAFPKPLTAQGAPTPAEQKALHQAIAAYQKAKDPLQTLPLEAFLVQYPKSPWTVSLWYNIGLLHQQAGDYPAAARAFNLAVVTAGPNPQKGYSPEQEPADHALAELLTIETAYGHADQVTALLANPRAKEDGGVLTGSVGSATKALWTMRHDPQSSYRCGVEALEKLLGILNPHSAKIKNVDAAKSTSAGLSLAELQTLAAGAGTSLQAVRITPTSPIPYPSVMHWTIGHYTTVLGMRDGKYRVYDPAFGREILINREVLRKNSSGYFLIAKSSPVAPGWRLASATEEAVIRGTGTPSGPNNPRETGLDTPASDQSPPGTNAPCDCSSGGGSSDIGVPSYSVALMLTSLRISDNPVGYKPPIGPTMEFMPVYNEQDGVSALVGSPNYGNLGPQWSNNWLSFVIDNPTAIGADVTVVTPGGGYKTETGYKANPPGPITGGSYAPEERSAATLVLVSSPFLRYERRFSDGSMDVYTQPSCTTNCGTTRKVYLTEIVDSHGNALTLAYDQAGSAYRLRTVTDAIGQHITLNYSNQSNNLLLTSVTDPFGRTATLGYDASGRLDSLTDAMNLQSTFVYGTGTNITSMTTPYGTTSFVYTPPSGSGASYTYSLNITDPLGFTERYEFNQNSGSGYPPFSLPDASSPSNWQIPPPGVANIFNQYLYGRDVYHWDKATYAISADQTNHFDAVIYHFQHMCPNFQTQTSGVLEAVFNPLDDAIWYTHQNDGINCQSGAQNSGFIGTLDLPAQIGRIVPNPSGTPALTTQLTNFAYNSFGRVTQEIDPIGRQTNFAYASNNVDVTSITQKTSASTPDTLTTITWNNQHEPLTVKDAAGETTTYTYNSQGQILTKTDALGNVTSYAYANQAGTGTGNFLHTITDANNQVVATYTYDSVGRVATYTDSLGYTLSYSYDNLDRLTKIAYPDSTTTTYTYTNQDLTQVKDRLNRVTTYAYDKDRNLISVTDPLNRATKYGYDPDGRLTSVTDPMGHVTTWTRDLEGRVITKTYPDGTSTNYTYDIAGRLSTRTDAIKNVSTSPGQVTTYGYALDDRLISKTYTNTLNPTPNVTYTWDRYYPRLIAMTDGSGPGGTTGTTNFSYWPAGQLGALQFAAESGPRGAADFYFQGYDELGRVNTRWTGGTSVTDHIFTYDALGRITEDNSVLGPFFYSYVGETGLLSGWGLNSVTGAVSTAYTYDPNNADDRRLSAISFPSVTNTELLKTDPGSLAGYQVGGTGRVLDKTMYTDSSQNGIYDAYSYDVADQLTGDIRSNFKPPNTYTPKDSQAFAFNNDGFITSLTVPSPMSQVYGGWTATPQSNSDEVKTLSVSSALTFNYTYDADGNLLDNQTSSFTWDAENRLLTVKPPSNGTSYRYDGLNRRVAIINSAGIETDYLWCGFEICAAYTPSGTITARYIEQGESRYSGTTQTNYYYQRDHLGSVVGLVNSSGAAVGSQFYSQWGWNWPSGTAPQFGFAGMFYDQNTGLFLTLNRAYDQFSGRWLSRDPAGELADGTNLYAYVGGDPINNVDLLGLAPKDKTYGLPKAFWNWYHRQRKEPGDPDLSKDEAQQECEDWKKMGQPGPDSPGTMPDNNDNGGNSNAFAPPQWLPFIILVPVPGNPIYGGF